MGEKADKARFDWMTRSASLSVLNNISIGLLSIGALVVVIGFISGSFLVAYIGGGLMGFGASTGILALAVNAIVGTIARSQIY